MSSVPALLDRIEAALEDADATISTGLGDHQESTTARLWQGQVLVDWEPDARAGGCLLRPALLRRLVALHARVDSRPNRLSVIAPGRILEALSPDHADLVRRLGGPRRLEIEIRLQFAEGDYLGGDETYWLVDATHRHPLLQLNVRLQVRKGRDVRSA